MLSVEAEGENKMIVRSPKSLVIHEVFGNPVAAGREIGIDPPHFQERVRLAGGDIDDIREGLPGARFSGELVEDPGGVGPIMLGLEEGIAGLKLGKQRLKLIDGGKTINHDPAFFFCALTELLLAIFALQP